MIGCVQTRVLCFGTSDKMPSNKRKISTAARVPKSRQNSQKSYQSIEKSQNSQKSKTRPRAKNYTAEESRAIVKCCEKYKLIINKNSSSQSDTQQKERAWEIIKKDFDAYCKSQGFYVSRKFFS